MSKSVFAEAVDQIQTELRPFLREQGFNSRGRTFNRVTAEGLKHVVNIQMGASDPPGSAHIPHLRPNLHGLFTINFGVFVPEVAESVGNVKQKTWVQEYDCAVQRRIGSLVGEGKEIWWHARAETSVISDVKRALEQAAFAFFESFGTRDLILHNFTERIARLGASRPPRIVKAIILAKRGEMDKARDLLAEQVHETLNPGHPEYVRKLARSLGIEQLND
jgi:hypothetical protein